MGGKKKKNTKTLNDKMPCTLPQKNPLNEVVSQCLVQWLVYSRFSMNWRPGVEEEEMIDLLNLLSRSCFWPPDNTRCCHPDRQQKAGERQALC